MKWHLTFLVTSLLHSIAWADAYDRRSDIYDFLVQDVCTHGSPGGSVDQSKLPHECATRRNMRPGDDFYYRTHGLVDNSSKKFRLGKFAWSSYPVVENGVRRILLLKDNGMVDGNANDLKFGKLDGGDGMSIRWLETSADGAAGMLFSVSPGGGAIGIEKGLCSRLDKSDVRRYVRNWVTAPKNVDGMKFDRVWGHSQQIGGVLTMNPQLFPDSPNVELPDQNDCGKLNFNHVFALAVRTKNFKYRNNASMESIIHQKFSVGSSLAKGPTKAKAFERIYLTRQYGVTR